MTIPYAAPAQRQLTDLPVELLAEIYLDALSPHLAYTCKHIYTAIKSFPASVHAQYILGQGPFHLNQAKETFTNRKPAVHIASFVITRALRYPLCTTPVLDAILRISSRITQIGAYDSIQLTTSPFELPKRLFRSLGDGSGVLGRDSEPLPFLRFLWDTHKGDDKHSYMSTHANAPIRLPKPDPNSHVGYPLVRAVHAGFKPLIAFLLAHGADPAQRSCMAVRVAIGKRDLGLVRMLVECPPEGVRSAKKRRREDRVIVEPSMVDLAVRCDARDIVQYLVQEKGCVPDMKTLRAM